MKRAEPERGGEHSSGESSKRHRGERDHRDERGEPGPSSRRGGHDDREARGGHREGRHLGEHGDSVSRGGHAESSVSRAGHGVFAQRGGRGESFVSRGGNGESSVSRDVHGESFVNRGGREESSVTRSGHGVFVNRGGSGESFVSRGGHGESSVSRGGSGHSVSRVSPGDSGSRGGNGESSVSRGGSGHSVSRVSPGDSGSRGGNGESSVSRGGNGHSLSRVSPGDSGSRGGNGHSMSRVSPADSVSRELHRSSSLSRGGNGAEASRGGNESLDRRGSIERRGEHGDRESRREGGNGDHRREHGESSRGDRGQGYSHSGRGDRSSQGGRGHGDYPGHSRDERPVSRNRDYSPRGEGHPPDGRDEPGSCRGRGYGGPRGGRGYGDRGDGEQPGGRGRGRGRGGRGGGRGRGRGAVRGARRERPPEEEFDLVATRTQNPELQTKQAAVPESSRILLQANYFKVIHKPNWCIYHYRVDFSPDETDTRVKKQLLKGHGDSIGAYIFDGSSLYVSHRIHPDPMSLVSLRESDQQRIDITVRLVAELQDTDVMYLQFFNILLRKCLETLQLEEMGRHFYDHRQAIRIDAHRLELWPGYKTSMRNHEYDILLGVEITHKVLRLDNCLQVINNMINRGDDQRKIKNALVGNIVMTAYNRKTYRVDDIDWDTTPSSTFEYRKRQITFIDYFQERYNFTIRDGRQPMLISRPKKKDYHRGHQGPIQLIPEFCQMTGLTDEMRANNNLMRALATHLHTDPMKRVEKLREFMRRLRDTEDAQTELQRWGLGFDDNLVELKGHVFPTEKILFGDRQVETPNDKYDWSHAFRSKPMLSSVHLKVWAVIVPSRDAHAVDRLVNSMQRVGNQIRFVISKPTDVRRLGDTRPNDYAKAVDTLMNEHKNKLQMLFVILPRQVADIYSAVKKRACIEFGVPSQCFVAKNAHNEKGLMSICTKLVVQMNAKLGGEPWTVSIPLKNLMVVGFDVHHCGKRKGASCGAMVATTSSTYAKYFSTVSYHSSRDDLSEKLGADFIKCLNAYQKVNNVLPDRIIMYRDGVGDGQLRYVNDTELKLLLEAMDNLYKKAGRESPKFTFIVVTKRLNTRIFAMEGHRHMNPGPGTVADDVITLPERYDFYLISQHSRQGTVSPVSYHVLYDRQGLDPSKMQRLTFKLCHMYFNWSGTVTVPAPCQYARKLAYLTGLALGANSHERLSNTLYYL